MNLPQKEKDKIKVLVGHFSFGLHEQLNGNFKYVTMLREPKARVISAYNYSRSIVNHDLHHLTNSQSLSSYLTNTKLGWLENGQTKFIAGVIDFNDPCTETVLIKAIENIEKYFLAVGVLERFDESIQNFANRLKWKKPQYEIKNITQSIESTFSFEDLQIVENMNKFDQLLYEYVDVKLGSELKQNSY